MNWIPRLLLNHQTRPLVAWRAFAAAASAGILLSATTCDVRIAQGIADGSRNYLLNVLLDPATIAEVLLGNSAPSTTDTVDGDS